MADPLGTRPPAFGTRPQAPGGPPPDDAPPPPLWVDGAVRLRVEDPSLPGDAREVVVPRPYALVGRLAGADVRVDDPNVGGRHLYLHLDGRGLFAVDLATRTGTRFNGAQRPCGWVRPGDAFEVAGRRITLLGLEVDDAPVLGGPGEPDDMLADAGPRPLVRLTLFPHRAPNAPRVLGSELVFLGRGACCGVQVDGASAFRVHCALVRTRRAAFAVDLIGRGTWLNGRPMRGAYLLTDGDSLMVGSSQFEIRVEPPDASALSATAAAPEAVPARLAALPAELVPAPGQAWPAVLDAGPSWPAAQGDVPPQQGAVLAWMLGLMQAQQGESLRRQGEFQQTLTGLVRQMQHDQAALLSEHLKRTEAIQRELATLREEIQRRLGPNAPQSAPALSGPKPPPLRIAPATSTVDSGVATSWLISRVSQLEEENRSTWKDLLGRLTGTPRHAP